MKAPIRGGGGSSSGPATSPTILVVGALLLWAGTTPCPAQPPPSAVPSGGGIVPGATAPPYSGATGLPSPGGAQPPVGGLPALPGTSGGGATGPGLGGMAATPGYNIGVGSRQPEPSLMPMRAEEPPPPPGPLPLANVVPLPALSLDHYGDGSGTTGAFLIWMGQLPHQYPISRYEDGNGKVGGPIMNRQWITPHSTAVLTQGTLSYGPPGLHPGFNGFGLSFHPGYGYGGNALGTGAVGGYPCYGGPGYPLHYGYPKFAYPYYEGIGQLLYDPPVVTVEPMDAGDFGVFTGASAYAYTHPSYAAEAAATGSFIPGAVAPPATSASSVAPERTLTPTPGNIPSTMGIVPVPVQERYLGMGVEPGVGTGGRQGLRIISILPGSTAQNAGLQVGDVILSINGQAIVQRSQLGQLIGSVPSGNQLQMTIIKTGTGQEQTLTIVVP